MGKFVPFPVECAFTLYHTAQPSMMGGEYCICTTQSLLLETIGQFHPMYVTEGKTIYLTASMVLACLVNLIFLPMWWRYSDENLIIKPKLQKILGSMQIKILSKFFCSMSVNLFKSETSLVQSNLDIISNCDAIFILGTLIFVWEGYIICLSW